MYMALPSLYLLCCVAGARAQCKNCVCSPDPDRLDYPQCGTACCKWWAKWHQMGKPKNPNMVINDNHAIRASAAAGSPSGDTKAAWHTQGVGQVAEQHEGSLASNAAPYDWQKATETVAQLLRLAKNAKQMMRALARPGVPSKLTLILRANVIGGSMTFMREITAGARNHCVEIMPTTSPFAIFAPGTGHLTFIHKKQRWELSSNTSARVVRMLEHRFDKVFVNHALGFDQGFLEDVFSMPKRFVSLTHDYYWVYTNPQPTFRQLRTPWWRKGAENGAKRNYRFKTFLPKLEMKTQHRATKRIFDALDRFKSLEVVQMPDLVERRAGEWEKVAARGSGAKHCVRARKELLIGCIGDISVIKGNRELVSEPPSPPLPVSAPLLLSSPEPLPRVSGGALAPRGRDRLRRHAGRGSATLALSHPRTLTNHAGRRPPVRRATSRTSGTARSPSSTRCCCDAGPAQSAASLSSRPSPGAL